MFMFRVRNPKNISKLYLPLQLFMERVSVMSARRTHKVPNGGVFVASNQIEPQKQEDARIHLNIYGEK